MRNIHANLHKMQILFFLFGPDGPGFLAKDARFDHVVDKVWCGIAADDAAYFQLVLGCLYFFQDGLDSFIEYSMIADLIHDGQLGLATGQASVDFRVSGLEIDGSDFRAGFVFLEKGVPALLSLIACDQVFEFGNCCAKSFHTASECHSACLPLIGAGLAKSRRLFFQVFMVTSF